MDDPDTIGLFVTLAAWAALFVAAMWQRRTGPDT
jgi:hypothetical protein